MDFLSKENRSKLMSRIRGKHTKPELIVRRIVRQLGHRFRVYQPGLPAKPDLVFPSAHKVILVHGCFWHRHNRCRRATVPKTHVRFWIEKFDRNKRRDRAKVRQLQRRGWKTLTLWECETHSPEKLRERIREYLENH